MRLDLIIGCKIRTHCPILADHAPQDGDQEYKQLYEGLEKEVARLREDAGVHAAQLREEAAKAREEAFAARAEAARAKVGGGCDRQTGDGLRLTARRNPFRTPRDVRASLNLFQGENQWKQEHAWTNTGPE
jgi:hypothetical protein